MHSAALPERRRAGREEQASSQKGRQPTHGESARPRPKRPRTSSPSLPTSRVRMPTGKRERTAEGGRESSVEHEPSPARATVYDAVAGRVGYEGFLLDNGGRPMPPDQVLFRRAGAPVRYHEDDQYFAHRHLPAGQRLPDSDLLKAIHAYAADLYTSDKLGPCRDDWKSLDGTALLALGCLVEEAVAESLGETGHLAFVEHPRHTAS